MYLDFNRSENKEYLKAGIRICIFHFVQFRFYGDFSAYAVDLKIIWKARALEEKINPFCCSQHAGGARESK